MDVLHLAEGLSPSAVGDHATYVRALERITGAAAWSAVLRPCVVLSWGGTFMNPP